MNTSVILQPLEDMLFNYLPLLIGSMLSFVTFLWASKKLLYFLDISDYGIKRGIKKDLKRARELRNKNKINNSFLKTKQTKIERERRKKLYQIKQLRKTKQEIKRIKNAELQRIKFYNAKYAYDMRMDEKIKEAKISAFHQRINERNTIEKARYSKNAIADNKYIM